MMARDAPWETVWKFIKKLKTELPNEAGNSTSGYKPLRAESRVSKRYVYSHVHSSIIHKSQNMRKTQCPLMDERIKKKKTTQLWSVCRMWYYGALKRKEIVQYATTRMNLEYIMLRERSQSQKDKYHRIPLI